ncbi:MAG: inorganic diphosphatase [Chloroflexi bacterium]|nr:inorganic diphosphatase [Chloroflexota bacterium]
MQRTDLWHDIPTGHRAPNIIYGVVEIPRGHRNKYEYNKHLGVIQLSRVLFSPMHYPGDYGFVPQTCADDGDPFDILVMVTEPTFPGCVVEVRPIGMFRMLDRKEGDDKILAVPDADPLFGGYHSLRDVPQHFLAQVGHFFLRYKELEGAEVEAIGWEDVEAARETIRQAMLRYKKAYC